MKPGTKISEPRIIITPDSARKSDQGKEPTTLEIGKRDSEEKMDDHSRVSVDSGRAISVEF